ncbi:MAG TPA: ATP-binding protein, partial [Acidimicrobiia bacterium]
VSTVILVAVLALLPVALALGGFLLTRSILTRRSLTRQLEISDALAAERQRRVEVLSDYELITENSADLIARQSPDLTYLWVSPSIRNVLGYAPAEAIGTDPWSVIHADDAEKVETARRELADGATTSSVEHRARHANGKWVWLHTVSRAVRDEDGRLVEIQSASRDVSEQVRQRSELIESKNAVEMAAAEKTRFLSTVSHEIRTPLTAVRGLTDLLLESELDQDQREQVETIRLASTDVMTLVNDLLDLAKAEAGHLRLDAAPFDLMVTIDNVIRVFAAQAEAKQLLLRSDVRNAPVGLIGDSHRLHQILVNLIGNALKFTSEGSITLRAEPLGHDGESQVTIHFEVADTGLGIPGQRLDAIFEEFEQAESSTARNFGGSGLGLGISKELVQLMGGVIGVESEEGAGSTFWFDIPFPLAQPTDAGWRRCRVVGRPMTRAPLAAMLRSNGWLIEEMDGIETIADVSGPVVFGGTIDDLNTIQIPEKLTFVDTLPQRGNADRARHLGARGYLGSPVGVDDLAYVVNGVAEGALFATRHEIEANARPLLVLAADDAPSNRLLLERTLGKRGHRVVAVPGGVRALEEVLSPTPYDVVILDGQMPDLSGMEVARRIRATESGTDRHIPIVALTGRVSEQEKAEVLDAGADVWVGKPFDASSLHEVIESLAMAHPLRPRPVEGAVEPSVDVELFMSQSGGMPDLAAELLEVARREWDELAPSLQPQAVAQDLETAARSAHRVKGVLGMLGAVGAARCAAELEKAANAEEVIEARAAAEELQAAYLDAERALL